MLATSPVFRFGKINSVVRFDLAALVEHFLPRDRFDMPLALRREILLLSGHIRIGTRSFMYVYYP
jgi:hypothetical protein